jgi:hypothetical protein
MNKAPDPIERETVAVQVRIADALERIAVALEKLAAGRTGVAEIQTASPAASDNEQVIEVHEIATEKDIADENQITAENYEIESDDADIPDENKITTDDYRIVEDDCPPDNDAASDNQNEPKEKRKHPRKPCSIVVDYASRDRAFRDYIRDISSGGVFIETSKEFSIGDEIMMTFSISSKQKPFKFTGQVVRITNQGIGVKFKKKFTK